MKKVFCLLLSVVLALPLLSAGYAQDGTGVIRGWAFHDLDNDGLRDLGEPGLEGTVICLVGHNWCDHTEWGEFEFDMLPAGKYKVRLTDFPNSYHRTTRKQVVIVLEAGEIRADVDFGLAEIPGHATH